MASINGSYRPVGKICPWFKTHTFWDHYIQIKAGSMDNIILSIKLSKEYKILMTQPGLLWVLERKPTAMFMLNVH